MCDIDVLEIENVYCFLFLYGTSGSFLYARNFNGFKHYVLQRLIKCVLSLISENVGKCWEFEAILTNSMKNDYARVDHHCIEWCFQLF